MSDILKIEDLVIQYDTDSGCVHALNGLSLTLREGETLGLVGETGAGKTTLARSIMGLIQCPPGKIVRRLLRQVLHRKQNSSPLL